MPPDHRLYPVWCCCQPRRILGYLELPTGLKDGQRLAVQRPLSVRGASPDIAMRLTCGPETILMRTFFNRDVEEIAVYSEDRPLEFWSRLPNFTPAVDVGAGARIRTEVLSLEG